MIKKDVRGIVEVRPDVELQDYSGPFKPDLRFVDFSREQLARMYLMACEYFYRTLEAYQDHILEKYGIDAVKELLKDVWAVRLKGAINVPQIKRKWMNIQGNDLSSLWPAPQKVVQC